MLGGGSRVVQGRLDQWWSGGGLVAWFRGGFVVVRVWLDGGPRWLGSSPWWLNGGLGVHGSVMI